MRKSKISKTAANVFSDIMYETLKKCKTADERRVLINLNDEIIKQRYQNETIGDDSCEIMINCFDRERADLEETTKKLNS